MRNNGAHVRHPSHTSSFSLQVSLLFSNNGHSFDGKALPTDVAVGFFDCQLDVVNCFFHASVEIYYAAAFVVDGGGMNSHYTSRSRPSYYMSLCGCCRCYADVRCRFSHP